MGGGIPVGDSLVLAGPTGTGKTTFAMKFIAAGHRCGRDCGDRRSSRSTRTIYLQRAKSSRWTCGRRCATTSCASSISGPSTSRWTRRSSRSARRSKQVGAKRVVIDSISGFEMALAPSLPRGLPRVALPARRRAHRAGRHHVLDRRGGGGRRGDRGLQLTGYQVSFLTDDILSQRYVEIEGELRKALVVVKMRGSSHSRRVPGLRDHGHRSAAARVAPGIRRHHHRHAQAPAPYPARRLYPGLTEPEVLVLEMVIRAGADVAGRDREADGAAAAGVEAILERLVQLELREPQGRPVRGRGASARDVIERERQTRITRSARSAISSWWSSRRDAS